MLNKWPPLFIESGKEIAISRYKTGYGMDLHTHDYFEIEYVIYGCCRQRFKNEYCEFSRGDVALFKPNSRHSLYSSNEIEIFKITIKPEFLPKIYTRFCDSFNSSTIIHLPFNEVKKFENILFAIEKEFNDQNEFFLDVITGYLEVIFAMLIRFNRIQSMEEKTSNSEVFKMILSYIEKNLKTVTPSSVAAYSGYNSPYFSKLFKKNIGLNLSEYINQRRLEQAQRLLCETNKSIENIGYDVGFNHKSYFHRVFKKYYGVTPEEYRKANETTKKYTQQAK